MSYSEVVSLIISILSTMFSLMLVHYIVFGLVGLFKKKKYSKALVQKKYGIIIPARNEGNVIGNLIKSIKANNYDQDKLHIFVIAHNCTDNSAEVARQCGATVYEYNNDAERTKGYALKYLFQQIEKDYKISSFDGFMFFDADNLLSSNYIEKMNDAFVSENEECIITSYRNSKNFGTNIISAWYGLFFMSACRFESRGRTICNCSTRVQGTGFCASSKVLANGWNYVTLTEDWEFTADQILSGTKLKYCDDAIFYDEQPTNLKVFLRQRIRWDRGHWLVFLTRSKLLFKKLFSKKSRKEAKEMGFSYYDIFVNTLPISALSTTFLALQAFLLIFAPIFQTEVASAWIGWAISLGTSVLGLYVTFTIAAILTYVLEKDRIKNVSPWLKVVSALTWPVYMLINIPLEFVAIFSKNITWKTIPHTDTTTTEALLDKKHAVREVRGRGARTPRQVKRQKRLVYSSPYLIK